MSHSISKQSGKDEMFYVGKVPWHGLGTKLEKPATAAEAIKAASLDWEVGTEKMITEVTKNPVNGYRAVLRKDVGISLGVVGPDYQPIQNEEAFGFFDSVVGEGQAIYHTAGALGLGEKIWMLAKLPGEIRIENDKDDVTQEYLLLTTGHDGKTALRMFFTPVRVVCQNTLNMAMGSRGETVTIQHRGDVKGKVSEAQRVMGIAVKHYQKFEEQANWLSRIEVRPENVKAYIENLFPAAEELTKRQRNSIDTLWGDVTARFEGERGTSLWHLANAVVEYVDHGQRFKNSQRYSVGEARFRNVLMGRGAAIKNRAFSLAREMSSVLA